MVFTYLILNILTISFPLLRSFEDKLEYYKGWKHLFTAIFITGGIFIAWDIWFTKIGIWSFNPDYLTGVNLINLPIEEWLFFLTVPFACTFIFEVIQYYLKPDKFKGYEKLISTILISILTIIGLLSYDKLYTVITFISTAIVIAIIQWVFQWKKLNLFYIAYGFCLLPFFFVNGVLTYLPVVQYNDSENLGIRMGSIPVEDSIYGFLLLIMVAFIYDCLKSKS